MDKKKIQKILKEKSKQLNQKAIDEKLDQQYLLKQEKKGVARAIQANLDRIAKAKANSEKLSGIKVRDINLD